MREAGEDGTPTIVGYGAVFDSPSLDLGGFQEYIAAGAFRRSLKSKDDIKSYYNHDPSMILGSRDAGNLKVYEDERGLVYEVQPPDTTYVADLLKAMRAKLVRGSSFAFQVVKDEWKADEQGRQIRTLLDVRLMEVGPVVQPAYPKTTSAVRSMLEARGLTLAEDGTVATREDGVHDMLEDLSGPVFDAVYVRAMRKHLEHGAEMAGMATARAGSPGVKAHAGRMLDGYQSALSELDALDTGGRAIEPPTDDGWQIRAAHRRRTLELMQLR